MQGCGCQGKGLKCRIASALLIFKACQCLSQPMEVIANARRKIRSWHPTAMSFPSTAGGMERPEFLGQVRNRCKNSWPPSFLRIEQPAWMEQLVPAPLGSGGLPCAKRAAGRQARLEGPFTRVLPGAVRRGEQTLHRANLSQKAAHFHAPELLRYLRHVAGNSATKSIC